MHILYYYRISNLQYVPLGEICHWIMKQPEPEGMLVGMAPQDIVA